MSVLDTATNTVTATVAAGPSPSTVAITRDGTRAYIAGQDGNAVSVLAIDTPPALTGNAPAGTVGLPYRHAYTLGGQPAPTVAVTGVLPPGLTLTPAGVLSGTPTAAGSYPVTLTASNGIGVDAVRQVTVVVSDPAPEPPAGSLPDFGS